MYSANCFIALGPGSSFYRYLCVCFEQYMLISQTAKIKVENLAQTDSSFSHIDSRAPLNMNQDCTLKLL
jgi:hypothetical protein